MFKKIFTRFEATVHTLKRYPRWAPGCFWGGIKREQQARSVPAGMQWRNPSETFKWVGMGSVGRRKMRQCGGIHTSGLQWGNLNQNIPWAAMGSVGMRKMQQCAGIHASGMQWGSLDQTIPWARMGSMARRKIRLCEGSHASRLLSGDAETATMWGNSRLRAAVGQFGPEHPMG